MTTRHFFGPGKGSGGKDSPGKGHPIMYGKPPPAQHFEAFPDGGGYPKGFVEWALAEMGCDDPTKVLHLCSGSMVTGVRVDIRSEMKPDIVADCRNVQLPAAWSDSPRGLPSAALWREDRAAPFPSADVPQAVEARAGVWRDHGCRVQHPSVVAVREAGGRSRGGCVVAMMRRSPLSHMGGNRVDSQVVTVLPLVHDRTTGSLRQPWQVRGHVEEPQERSRTHRLSPRHDALRAPCRDLEREAVRMALRGPRSGGEPMTPETEKALRRVSRKLADAAEERDRLIRQAVAEGGSLRHVANAAGLSHPGVKKIVERG